MGTTRLKNQSYEREGICYMTRRKTRKRNTRYLKKWQIFEDAKTLIDLQGKIIVFLEPPQLLLIIKHNNNYRG